MASAESSVTLLNPSSRQVSLSVEISERLQHTQPHPLPQTSAWSSNSSTSTDTGDEQCLDGGHRLLGRTLGARQSAGLRTRSGSLQVEVGYDRPVTEGDRLTDLEKELMATKCELAKVLNRQTCFHEILKQKDEIIEDLDEKLGSKTVSHESYDSKRRMSAANKEYQERIRVLQNQNRFLNEEVRRLAKLRSQENEKIKLQESKVRSLEADIEVWKLEYISLIQSSIRFTGTDTMDDAELSLFGGDRHKHRILSLLDEARKINPSLPTYEHLASGEVHVDSYGFKHHFSDDGLLLHYLCQELSQHFLCQASSYEKHQKNWLTYLKTKSKNLMANKKDLKGLVRAGIPDHHRRQMWRTFVLAEVDDIIVEKGAHYFRSLCSAIPDSPLAARYRKQISLDLMRTMPSNVKFSTPGSKGIMDLQDILLAFCIHNPTVGYCQGMNFLVAMALLFMDAQDAFWTLVAVTERYHSPSYFDHNLLGAQADQMVLRDLMAEKMPELAKHLDAIDIEISTVTLNWFLAIFFDAVPFPTLLRIWDCFLLEGPKVLFRFSLAILHIHTKEIILKCDTISVMRHLKTCAKITYDVDGLMRTAFKTLKPFPRRQDIVSKQTCYLNALKEKYRFRDLQRAAFAERENFYLNNEADADNYTGFECCVITKPGEAWVAYGEPPCAKICVVDCREQIMIDTRIMFDTRVMSMAVANTDMVLIGTLSWIIYAYNQNTRDMSWQYRVHDAVLSMQVYKEDDTENSSRLFAGLADGTVAVFETVSLTCTNYDLLYLPIGQSPVTCLQLLGNQLWCACGNTVSIIHASTLDPMDRFTVSGNPYDTVLSLVPGLPGVWISVRGSSVLELWDPMSLSCKMLYDIRTGKYPNLRKEDDTYFNAARITSILAMDYSVWVGTGEGTLITFDVFTQTQRTPSDTSPFLTENALIGSEMSHSWKSSVSIAASDCESYARLLEVERRVKDLYHQRQTVSKQLDYETGIDPGNEESSNFSIERNRKSKQDEEMTLQMGEFEQERGEGANSRSSESTDSVSSTDALKSKTIPDVEKEGEITPTSNKSQTISTDSAKTDALGTTDETNGTNISPASAIFQSSNLRCKTEHESISLYDSGYTQTSVEGSGSSSLTNNSLNETLRQNNGHEDNFVDSQSNSASTLNTDLAEKSSVVSSAHRDAKKIVSPQSKLPSSETVCLQAERNSSVEETINKENKSRTKKKSEDSGISLICEKNTDETIFSDNNRILSLQRKSSLCSESGDSQQTTTAAELHNFINKVQDNSSAHISFDSSSFVNKNNGSLKSNGRSKSQDSNKTVGSDDVFPETQVNQELQLQDVSTSIDPQVNHGSGRDSISNGFYLNGNISGSDLSEEEYEQEPKNFEALPHAEKLVQSASVKSLTARFEANVSKEDTDYAKLNLRRSKSLKMNFKPSVQSKIKTGKDGISDIEEQVSDSHSKTDRISDVIVKYDDSEYNKAGLNKEKTVDGNSLASLPCDSVSAEICIHEKERKHLSCKDKEDTSHRLEIQAVAQQLGQELENVKKETTSNKQISITQHSTGSFHVKSRSKVKTQDKHETLSAPEIDTKFYGDSDEDSRVHEARVQSFKDSYKRKSISCKHRVTGAGAQEDAFASDDSNSANITNALPGTNESKATNDSNNFTTDSGNVSRKSSTSGLSSITSAVSKKISFSAVGRQNSDASFACGNFQPQDPDAQWRLDYTNIHVDTDRESLAMSSASASGGESDSQPESRRLSCVSSSSDMKDQRLNQFLRDTANTFNSQLGLPIEDEKQMMAFLSTPTMSIERDGSAGWSSYDEISTPSQRNGAAAKPNQLSLGLASSSIYSVDSRTSIASTLDMFYGADLSLLSKNKISDKPVKWLVATEIQGKPVVLSFSGCHNDDEAVLIWSREANETLWTNSPVLEYNPTTRRATLPWYMRPQMPSSASNLSCPRHRQASVNY